MPSSSFLVVDSAGELDPRERVWGTGGWLEPEAREALDWLTLARFLGWSTRVVTPGQLPELDPRDDSARWIVVTGTGATEPCRRWLETALASRPVLVVLPAPRHQDPLAGLAGAVRAGSRSRAAGAVLSWCGPGEHTRWTGARVTDLWRLEPTDGLEVWARYDDVDLVAARRCGRGTVATLAFHPGRARDGDGAFTALLRRLLSSGTGAPAAWLDFERTMVLRMDDPGGAQNVHLESWCYPKLGAAAWSRIGDELRRRDARLSVAYVPGWVDDGDSARGELIVAGRPVERVPGAVHSSETVLYRDLAGHRPGLRSDYAEELAGIRALRREGLADLELHGHTHLHPDRAAWLAAPDRYTSVRWYRELGRGAAEALRATAAESHPVALGVAALRDRLGVMPTTLICPGDEFESGDVARALDLGLHVIGSYYLAIRHDHRFVWCYHVCAPYLDEPDASWLRSGLPVVGYFHDRDLVEHGVDWLARCLDAWQQAGVERFIDFRELAGALSLTVDALAGGELQASAAADAPRLVRPAPVSLALPTDATARRLIVP